MNLLQSHHILPNIFDARSAILFPSRMNLGKKTVSKMAELLKNFDLTKNESEWWSEMFSASSNDLLTQVFGYFSWHFIHNVRHRIDFVLNGCPNILGVCKRCNLFVYQIYHRTDRINIAHLRQLHLCQLRVGTTAETCRTAEIGVSLSRFRRKKSDGVIWPASVVRINTNIRIRPISFQSILNMSHTHIVWHRWCTLRSLCVYKYDSEALLRAADY